MTVQAKTRETAVASNDVGLSRQGSDAAQRGGAGLRVLHIEDNAADALLAETYVRSVIPDVEFDSAVRMSDVTPERVAAASCAILDLSLPDASGLDALHALREMSADVPIIVLTGFDDLEVGLSAIRHGAEDYLVKNYVDGDSLQRAMRYAMERRRLSSALEGQGGASAATEHNAVRSDTHQVSIDVQVETSVLSLRCQTCSWEAKSDLSAMSSWGHLERVLLPHVAFGGNAQPSVVLQTAARPTDPARLETTTPGTWLG